MGKQLDIQKYRIDFMIGIAASVVASLLITTGGWVFDAISNIDIGVIGRIEDAVYSRAAAVTPYTTTLLILELVISAALAVIIFTAIVTICGEVRLSKSLAAIETKYCEAKSSMPQKENEVSQEKPKRSDGAAEEPQREYLSLMKENRRLKQEEKQLKKEHKTILCEIVALTIVLLALIAICAEFIATPVRLRAQFEQELYIVSPYTDEQTIAQLKSSWVLMKTKDDFIDIYDMVENIHAEYCIDGYKSF